MNAPLKFVLQENVFWLSPERSVFWEEQKALIVSDLHFGKTGHFRKSGIGVPQSVYKKDLQRLFHLIQFFKPEQLLIVGDMFHSEANKELELFKRWRNDSSQLSVKLIKGNHDILHDSWYNSMEVELFDETLQVENFLFTHHPVKKEDAYVFSGHIHPGVRISGLGRQSLSFPCFYFSPAQAILPAFSEFTGFVSVNPSKKDKVFAIVNKEVIAFS